MMHTEGARDRPAGFALRKAVLGFGLLVFGGQRTINEREAVVILRIFTEYAEGRSPWPSLRT